ncbi:hypothetical protein [Ascidiimonas sp. W6]|uniref:hypothetical protein n=1 Tax=Ascidiimonas meishanensis TaxID=3128903 RepID=UPI0030EBA5F5
MVSKKYKFLISISVKIFYVVALVISTSCKSGLDKKYQKSSLEQDLENISEQVSKQDLILVRDYIGELEANNISVENKTYFDLLIEAENSDRERKRKIEEEKQLLLEQKNKKIADSFVKILSSKKWIVTDYAFQLEIPDDSEKNIEIAKNILNKAMFLKDETVSVSVKKVSAKTIVEGRNERFTRLFSHNGKRWKKYLADGTFEENSEDKTIKGTWELTDVNEIQEKKKTYNPTNPMKADIVYLEIKKLNDKFFNFVQTKYDYLNPNSRVSVYISMEAKED